MNYWFVAVYTTELIDRQNQFSKGLIYVIHMENELVTPILTKSPEKIENLRGDGGLISIAYSWVFGNDFSDTQYK